MNTERFQQTTSSSNEQTACTRECDFLKPCQCYPKLPTNLFVDRQKQGTGKTEMKTVVTKLTYEFIRLERILLSLRFMVMKQLVSGVIRTAAGRQGALLPT
jgi:hypothetical protein